MFKRFFNTQSFRIPAIQWLVLISLFYTNTIAAPQPASTPADTPANLHQSALFHPFTLSTFFHHELPGEVIMAEEVMPDDDVLENFYQHHPVLLFQSFYSRQIIAKAHSHSTASNRHLYLLYCSWRHFISL
ncbi:hypothetical protein [Emticicia sp. TH156]|uniref:hypothetical protein n=1 Tax=Emticicia sp. TH156 TaxID=2067454 RepID=UPI000C785080|nr:hypothetical protein [Emticicia sp. TH156]PLK42271.1 hypothetical protein C0V77_21900 [Emticicia sp. TH156]